MNRNAMTISLATLVLGVLAGCTTLGDGNGTKASKTEALELAGTSTRPQLTDKSATGLTSIPDYFAHAGDIESLSNTPWDPVKDGIGDVKNFKPTFVVAADGSGTHKTVQAAIDAAVKAGGAKRVWIMVKPGTYREQVCTAGAPPLTLYGMDNDASKVVIIDNKSNGTKKDPEVSLNSCESRHNQKTYGTSGSTTFLAYSDGFQAKNVTFANDFDESSTKHGPQAVAVTTTGDEVLFENVRFIGNQDTLQVKSPKVNIVSRVYVKDSYIEGDVDYVFGRAAAVFDHTEFKSLTRPGSEGGFVFAPSHAQNFPVGFLAIQCKFTSDGQAPAGSMSLGRAWDDSSGSVTTQDGHVFLPNGEVVIAYSEIGAHINATAPWHKAASTNRPFSSDKPVTAKFGKPKVDTVFPVNRLYEYRNTGPGAAK